MPTVDLREQKRELQIQYEQALQEEADIHKLAKLWQRIKEIEIELSNR